MIIGPKYKICKRLGGAVFEKCQTQKFTLSEARIEKKKSKRGGQASDFKRQLIEKQKMRFSFGKAIGTLCCTFTGAQCRSCAGLVRKS